MGSISFVGHVRAPWGIRAKGRSVIGGNEKYQLMGGSAPYKALFGTENDDIGIETAYFWGINIE